VKKNLLGS